jgi:hypothetical protein
MKSNRCRQEHLAAVFAFAAVLTASGCVGDEQTRVRGSDSIVRTERDARSAPSDLRGGAPIERRARNASPRHIVERPSRVRQ